MDDMGTTANMVGSLDREHKPTRMQQQDQDFRQTKQNFANT